MKAEPLIDERHVLDADTFVEIGGLAAAPPGARFGAPVQISLGACA
jgi:hypothetical protein